MDIPRSNRLGIVESAISCSRVEAWPKRLLVHSGVKKCIWCI